jgi:hypothetical protein
VRNLPDARDEVRIAVKSPKLPELQRSLLNVVVYSAAVQGRDGAVLVLDRRTRRFFPFIKCIFADAAYQGLKTAAAIAKTGRKLEIVKRDDLHLPRASQTLDRRTNARLNQPRSAPHPLLRALRAIRYGVNPSRIDLHHAPPIDQLNSLLLNPNFLDRL